MEVHAPKDFSRYYRWDVIAMFCSLAILTYLEMMGVFTNSFVTITFIVRKFIPKWVRAMVCGWLYYHFVVQD